MKSDSPIDWPLAIGLLVFFVLLSYARWRWFRSRFLKRPPLPPRDEPPTG